MIENAPNVNATNHFEEILSIVTDTKLQKLLEKVECEYLYWDKVKYLVPKDIKPELFWAAVKTKRQMQLKTVEFGNYKFYFSITPAMQNMLHDFDVDMGAGAEASHIIKE